MNNMIVGLTGGIGSGKSEVSRRFELLGITVIDADIIAREVVAPGSEALTAITAHFGQKILNHDKTLNRGKLRELIFENSEEKKWLEKLLHPIIRTETIAQLERSKSPYTILSSPLLLETTQHELVDRILVIDANEDLQLARASARDANNTEQIKKIMATQMQRSERCAHADDIIHNHGDLQELDMQIKDLHKYYLDLVQQHPKPI
jgi:dephospho-CoA kinase